MIYKSEDELIYKARQAEGKTFGEIDESGRIKNEKAKGHLGQIIEESFFGYEVNSKSEADFVDLGIELKVTPVKRNKNGTLSAKERLVLNIINYHKEVTYEFNESSFWTKNKEILMMFYEWRPQVKRADYQIIKAHLHKYPEEDLEVIKKDWEFIVKKIKDGQAHELSEADTNYLGACTKGANKKSLRSQPFSDEQAMQRAFSLKQSYMTALIRKINKQDNLIQFFTTKELKEKTVEQILEDKFSSYKGMSLEKIARQENIQVQKQAKSYLQLFISELLGVKGTNLDQTEEFAKANIQLKTVRLEPNSIPKEHMSFKNIHFKEWLAESWESSWVNNHFSETKFLFVVFQYKETKKENPDRQLYFKNIKLWNMPKKEIEGRLHSFWSQVQSLIDQGIKMTPVEQKNRTIIMNNLPKPGNNGLCHIRPKGRDGQDKVELPDGRMIGKQAFWLDREYIAEIIKE